MCLSDLQLCGCVSVLGLFILGIPGVLLTPGWSAETMSMTPSGPCARGSLRVFWVIWCVVVHKHPEHDEYSLWGRPLGTRLFIYTNTQAYAMITIAPWGDQGARAF